MVFCYNFSLIGFELKKAYSSFFAFLSCSNKILQKANPFLAIEATAPNYTQTHLRRELFRVILYYYK